MPLMPDREDNELENAIGNAMTEVKTPTPSLKPVPKQELTLSQQWGKLEAIETELRDRIRREKLKIISDYEASSLAIQSQFSAKISEEVARLEKLRDQELLNLGNATHDKLHEHDLLIKRMGAYSDK